MTTKSKAGLYAIVILICAAILLALDANFNRPREEQERVKEEQGRAKTRSTYFERQSMPIRAR
jgi:hypothetical protein